MPATERYQVDVFAIIVLIAMILILVFLIIAAIYFLNLMNLKPPSKGESTFLFWTAVILAVASLAIVVLAIIHIFTHKAVVYEEPKPVVKAPTTAVVAVQAPPIAPKLSMAPTEPEFFRPSEISTTFSAVPVTSKQQTALEGEILSLQSALSD